MWDSDRSVSCLPRLHRLLALTSSTAERTGTGPEASGYALRWRANALYLRTCIPASASAARRATASVTLSLKLSLFLSLSLSVCGSFGARHFSSYVGIGTYDADFGCVHHTDTIRIQEIHLKFESVSSEC